MRSRKIHLNYLQCNGLLSFLTTPAK
jgi:hypothetical protein